MQSSLIEWLLDHAFRRCGAAEEFTKLAPLAKAAVRLTCAVTRSSRAEVALLGRGLLSD
jgi:hypothetical protein